MAIVMGIVTAAATAAALLLVGGGSGASAGAAGSSTGNWIVAATWLPLSVICQSFFLCPRARLDLP